jgi:outer membrane biosynthesis protein TonB
VKDWRGLIALILALGVALAFLSGVIIAEVSPNMITEQETTFFSTLGGAIMGALATYLGVQHLSTNGGKSMETETPERDEPVEPEPVPEPEHEPEPAPPDKESDEQTQIEPTPPESEEEEVEAMTGGEDPADL